MNIREVSRVILELHRAGREVSYSAFQPTALALMREIIPFDSAWWGNASAASMEIHRLYLDNCDASILEAYKPYLDQDFFRAALMSKPGTTINMADLINRHRYVRTELYREVGKRYKIEWSLGTLLVEPVSLLYEFLTLWRHDPARPFNNAERKAKELLMPHLSEAHRAARLRALLDGETARSSPWAVVDERGFLRAASPAFVHFLREHWPDWQGSQLPDALHENVRAAKSFGNAGLKLRITAKGDFRYLEALPFSALDRLTARESEIAGRYAKGETYARIAANLNLSPSTVRNHIARCYEKLAVSNKVELAIRLSQLNGP